MGVFSFVYQTFGLIVTRGVMRLKSTQRVNLTIVRDADVSLGFGLIVTRGVMRLNLKYNLYSLRHIFHILA
jgi:hypothetical protein